MKKLLYSVCALSMLGGGVRMAHEAYGTVGLLELAGVRVPERIKTKTVEKLVEVNRKIKFDEALTKRLKSSPLPNVLVRGVLRKEGKENPKRMSYIRSEWANDYHRKFAQGRSTNPDEQRQWASSHCPFQVMAFHAAKAGHEWSDLYDPEVCVDLGMNILETCWRDANGFDTLERVERTGRCYNGGSISTTNAAAIEYGRSLREWTGVAALEYAIEDKR